MIYVIEPHADDAFLSLGAHIEEWVKECKQVTIVTVYSGTRKRKSDAQNYANAVGAKWIGMSLVESEGGLKCEPKIIDPNNFNAVFPFVRGDVVIIPLAIGHPEHYAVRGSIELFLEKLINQDFLSVRYYLDSPYQISQKLNNQINKALQGMTVNSYRKPSSRKWRHIPLFRDQQKFFYFNPPAKLQQCFEMIVWKQ